MSLIIEDLKSFIDRSPTSLHAALEIGKRLKAASFSLLDETQSWDLKSGGRYFIQRSGAICAFSLPLNKPRKLTLLGSHTDSPALKIKPKLKISENQLELLEIESYGSPLLNSWLNRDLAIAGKVVIENSQQEIEERLIYLDQYPLFIPQLPPHLDREIYDKGLKILKQEHLRPIGSLDSEKGLLKILKQQIGDANLLSHDLFLVPLDPTRLLGFNQEFMGAYRLDNLSSAHACLQAISASSSSESIRCALFWDHEEIGSETAQGAASIFFEEIYQRISLALTLSIEEALCLKRKSLAISVDVAHAYNPNYPDRYDPNHLLHSGKGIAIKYNANKRYATDASTAAHVIQACQKLKLSYQSFVSHSDIACGSTVGPIFAAKSGIATVDIGTPLFSMHSIREVMACQDHLDMCNLLNSLLNNEK